MTTVFFTAEKMAKAKLLEAVSWGRALKASPWWWHRAHTQAGIGVDMSTAGLVQNVGQAAPPGDRRWKEGCVLQIAERITGLPPKEKVGAAQDRVPRWIFPQQLKGFPISSPGVTADPSMSNPCVYLINRQPRTHQAKEAKYPVTLCVWAAPRVHTCPFQKKKRLNKAKA